MYAKYIPTMNIPDMSILNQSYSKIIPCVTEPERGTKEERNGLTSTEVDTIENDIRFSS